MFPETFLLAVYTCLIKFYFSGKRQRKRTKNLSKNVIENLFFLFEVIAPEHLGTQGTRARKHVSTQSTLSRQHASVQDTLVREHVSTQDLLALERVSTQGTLAREHVRHAI